MKLKTVSVDLEAFRLLRRAKGPRESYGDVVRRVFSELVDEVDIEKHLDEMMKRPPQVDIALLRRRQENPPRSRRPARRRAA